MRRFVGFFMIAALLVGLTAPIGQAAPSNSKVIVGAKAQFVSPTTIQIPVTYVCPASFGTGLVQVNVSQTDTGGSGFGTSPAPCTDDRETVVVNVTGGPFTLGDALAIGFIFSSGSTFFFADSDQRRIQIVL